ncbi:MAG TPA: translational GTPase TypA [Chromatiales bacterium]|nr:translational GTPase TypA [Chromatiaceae bacterium]HIO55382.1 translational GTPase TypA [Chromatiales bacterium]
MTDNIRNIAIIAHVDHGKTTLVDALLQQSNTLDSRKDVGERLMDSNDLEKERGITILSKNTAINWGGFRINMVDTPGHADFGGEVERVLSMVDSVLLLVDAVEGPMPQTRFVTQKAFAQGLSPIVVINKIDRDGARIDAVIDETFDLFDRLGATDEQLDFPIIYASGLDGYATLDLDQPSDNMDPLFQTIIDKTPPPDVDVDGPFQLQVSSLEYNSYVGAIGVGRITRGHIKSNSPVVVVDTEGATRRARILQIFTFLGLEKIESDYAEAGDIIAFTGIEAPRISDTVCDPAYAEALPALSVDEPTVSMAFQVNTSPFTGNDGKFVTSRQLRDRLQRELIHNVALRVEDTATPECFQVSGRGELHLSILIETMRREGYELAVSRPQVIFKDIDGERCEPWEQVTADVEDNNQGSVMEALAERGGQLQNLIPDGNGRVRLDYQIPARGLIGFRGDYMTMTSGTGLLYHVFDHYGPVQQTEVAKRPNGSMISNGTGKAVGFSLFNLQERGKMMVDPGTEVYEGMIVGMHNRANDLVVNPLKGKQLTNVRASGTDENIVLTPPMKATLEQALTLIAEDELVEITPLHIRLRKRHLLEQDRKKASRGLKKA